MKHRHEILRVPHCGRSQHHAVSITKPEGRVCFVWSIMQVLPTVCLTGRGGLEQTWFHPDAAGIRRDETEWGCFCLSWRSSWLADIGYRMGYILLCENQPRVFIERPRRPYYASHTIHPANSYTATARQSSFITTPTHHVFHLRYST